MHRLIPAFILERFDRNQMNGEFQATAMFLDIVGFTAMTQALMSNGKEGAEVSADVINRVFTPAINTIYEQGGFVSSFSGDAFTSVFPSDSVTVVDALRAALSLQRLFREEGRQQTRFGSFSLSVRIGLSHGPVIWEIIPHEQQCAFYFGGKVIERCAGNKHHAAEGEVIFDDEILSEIPASAEVAYSTKSSCLYSLISTPSSDVIGVRETPAPGCQNRFIPEEVVSMTGRGEFRNIISCFISFDCRNDLAVGAAKVITLAHRFGGYFNKIDFSDKGGIMLVVFGAPVNPGNLYNRALEFAIAAMEIPDLCVRIGLTYGTAFAGFVGSELRSEYTVVGSVVNLSARFIQKKKRAVTYIDQSIHKQTSSRYRLLELKPRKFKGFKGKTPVFKLIGKRETIQISSFEGRMVGRDAELDLLVEYLEPIKKGKFGGIIYIYGNPGIGKSRLLHELIHRQELTTLILRNDSVLKKPLNPFTYFFNHYFEQGNESSQDERKIRFKTIYQKLVGRIVSLSDAAIRERTIKELNRIESIIASIVGLFRDGSVYDMIPHQDRAVVTQMAIKDFFIALSLTEPIILLIEDIQWLDNESLDLLEILSRRIEDYPLIILACSRFNDDGSRPKLRIDEDVPRHSITLSELSQDSTRELTEDRLGNKVDSELIKYIQIRTEGNPFYTEQFCLYLQENSLINVKEGQYRLITELNDIPSDIYMILIARIDRLSLELKETVQIASVLGREFEVQVLTCLIELLHRVTPDVSSSLKGVEIRPLISMIEREGIWGALSELEYIFSHALLRDAAYDMQLRVRLRDLHRLTGDVLVNLYPDDKAIYADCAHHYERAKEWDRALEYCKKAGDYFHESLKYDEALLYRQKTLSISCKTVGEEHLNTAQANDELGEVWSDMGDYDAALSNFEKSLAIRLKLLGEKHEEIAVSYNCIGRDYLEQGDYNTALDFYEKAAAIQKDILGDKHKDTAITYNNIGDAHWYIGNYDEALICFEKALAIYKELLGEKHRETAISYNNIGAVHSKKGDQDTALTCYEKGLGILKESLGRKHPNTATSNNNIGLIYAYKGNFDTALIYLEEALAIQKEVLGEKHPATATSYNNIGSVHRRNDDSNTALAYYEKALAIKRELLGEKHPGTAITLGNIALVYASLERYSEAEQMFNRAISIFTDSLGASHPHTITTLKRMCSMYEKTDNETEAKQIRERLKELTGE